MNEPSPDLPQDEAARTQQPNPTQSDLFDGDTTPQFPGTAGGENSSRRFRWQFIVLAAGLLMIVGALLYQILGKRSQAETPVVVLAEGQVYSEASVGKPQLVNPLLAESAADRELASLIFSGLTRLDEYGEPVPDLAEGWEVSQDGLTYIFHLRQGITWHDGTPFTSADVDFTMELLRDPAFPGPARLAAFWRTVETYAVDDQTVKFILTQPLAAFPEYAGIGILPAHLLAGINPADLPSDPFNLSPVGTGQLWWAGIDDQKQTVTIHLTPYDRYYDSTRRIKLDDVFLHYYADGDDAFGALGDVLGYGGLSDDQLLAVLDNPDIQVYSARQPAYAAIVFNQQAAERLPFFQEEEVRQALVMGLDREQIIYEALPRLALPAYSTVLPGSWAYDTALEPLPYAPDQAAGLLDEAGWLLEDGIRTKEGQPMAFTLLVSDQPADRQIGEMVVEQWQAVGVDASLDVVGDADLISRLNAAPGEQGRRFDAVLIEFSQGELADPDPYPFWHEAQFETGQNFGGFADHEISQILEIARKDPNGVRRAELYRRFQQLFNERGAAVILYNPVYHYAVSCQVSGVQITLLTSPADRFRNMHEWRILSPDEIESACGE